MTPTNTLVIFGGENCFVELPPDLWVLGYFEPPEIYEHLVPCQGRAKE